MHISRASDRGWACGRRLAIGSPPCTVMAIGSSGSRGSRKGAELDKRLIALALLACTAASAAPRVPAARPLGSVIPTADAEPPISYTVRKGDNLYNLALHYMHHLNDYRIVQA